MALSLSLSLFLANCSSGPAVDGATLSTEPNVIVFMTDDQTLEQMRFLPNVEQLIGDQGTTFLNMVVNDSDCCPSRATFLTGQESHNHGVIWNSPPTGGYASFKNQETTLPVAMQSAGYQTIFVGKYLNRYGERVPEDRQVPPGWADFHGLIWPSESAYYGSSFVDNGSVTDTSDTSYYSYEITSRVIDSIKKSKGNGKSFFAWVGYQAPHALAGVTLKEYQADEKSILRLFNLDAYPVPEVKYRDTQKDLALPEDPSFNETTILDKAKVNQRGALTDQDINQIGEFYRAGAESLRSVDDSVKEIMDFLKTENLLTNTYVFFTSDNGLFYGEHRFTTGKYLPFRPSRSVPLLVSGPGIPKGRVSKSMVSNVDFAPTIADIANVKLLRRPDGLSLLPELLGSDSLFLGRSIYLEGHAPQGRLILPFEGIVTSTYLYYVFSNGESEYYDLDADYYELDNLVHSDPDNPKIQVARDELERHRNAPKD